MKLLKRIALGFVVAVAAYYAACGILYAAGFRWYRFPYAAMEPTISKGEHAFGRLSQNYRDHISRFDIAIYVLNGSPTDIYAKRVIGLPGEHIVITRAGVMINSVKLDLPSMMNVQGLVLKPCDVTIPADSIFVLGDNTPQSLDSRFIGPTPKQNVIGRIIFKK
jgi:signal peptidase I